MNPRRKLAAILFTDIVGYTQASNMDEVETLRLREAVERLVRDSAASNNGVVLKTIGDAVMIEFISAVEAVSCAINIQERMAGFNIEEILAAPLEVRIGVHVGDVVEEDGDLFGNAVNIAQRIQGMAEPGGICISREVYTQIRPILKLKCDVVTALPKKPLPEPIEVLSVTSDMLTDGARSSTALDRAPAWLYPASIAAFVLVWLVTIPLWAVGAWGGLLGGVASAVLLWPLLRYIASCLPHLRTEPRIAARGPRALVFSAGVALVFFGLSGGCASSGYMQALNEYSMRGWSANSTPWDFDARNKGQEYKLLNELHAFNGNPPAVSIEPGLPVQWNSSDRSPGPSIAMQALMAFLWLLVAVLSVLGAGRQSESLQKDKAAANQWLLTSMAVTIGLSFCLLMIWMFCDMIAPSNGVRFAFPERRLSVKADLKTVEASLEGWFTKNGYVVTASQGYTFNTVPKEKVIGGAVAYRACKSTLNEQWHRKLTFWQLKEPFLYVECVSSDNPVETVIKVNASNVVRNSALEDHVNTLLDGLQGTVSHK